MAYGYGGSRQSDSPMKSSKPKTSSKPKAKPKAPSKGGMTDQQKAALKRHMDQHKDLKDLSPSQLKSHRMKMMSRLRKGMTMAQAHRDVMK